MPISKSQKQLILLAVLLGAILVVVAVFLFKPPATMQEAPYVAPTVDARIPKDLTERPEYRRLQLQVQLPVMPGQTGRDNPFEPY